MIQRYQPTRIAVLLGIFMTIAGLIGLYPATAEQNQDINIPPAISHPAPSEYNFLTAELLANVASNATPEFYPIGTPTPPPEDSNSALVEDDLNSIVLELAINYNPLTDGEIPERLMNLEGSGNEQGEAFAKYLEKRNLATLCITNDLELPNSYNSAPVTREREGGLYTSVIPMRRPGEEYGILFIFVEHIGDLPYYSELTGVILRQDITRVIWEGPPDGSLDGYNHWQQVADAKGKYSIKKLPFYGGGSPPGHQTWINVDIKSNDWLLLDNMSSRMSTALNIYLMNKLNQVAQTEIANFDASKYFTSVTPDATSGSSSRSPDNNDDSIDILTPLDGRIYDDTNDIALTMAGLLGVCGRNPFLANTYGILPPNNTGWDAWVLGPTHGPDLIRRLEKLGYQYNPDEITWLRADDARNLGERVY